VHGISTHQPRQSFWCQRRMYERLPPDICPEHPTSSPKIITDICSHSLPKPYANLDCYRTLITITKGQMSTGGKCPVTVSSSSISWFLLNLECSQRSPGPVVHSTECSPLHLPPTKKITIAGSYAMRNPNSNSDCVLKS